MNVIIISKIQIIFYFVHVHHLFVQFLALFKGRLYNIEQ